MVNMSTWRWILLGLASSTLVAAQSVAAELDQNDLRGLMKRCCPLGQGLLSNYTCMPFETDPSQPRITFNEASGDDWGITCDSNHVLQQVNLNDVSTSVNENTVLLAWIQPHTATWELVNSFCAAAFAESEPENETQYVALFCYEDPMIKWQEDEIACQNATCIRKCCSTREIFNASCQPPNDGSKWSPHFQFNDDGTEEVPSDMLIVHGNPQCSVSLIHDDYSLLTSGMLELPGYHDKFPNSQYCLDLFANDNGDPIERAVVCHSEHVNYCWWRNFLVDTFFMSISCVFLGITWLTYVCIGELRSNTHGRCMISFITALFVAFVTILVNRHHMASFSEFLCALTGVVSHFSILATFFWLNILCYHIWNCLKSGRKPAEGSAFLVYSFYGWGCPLLVSLIGVILDAMKADVLRPDFVLPHCWFKDQTTKWIYLYGFMLVLLLVNLAFFLSSALMLTRRLRQTQDSRHHSEGLWLYLKLFIIMGITWVIEMITWLLEENSCATWVTILDGITALHGVFIFLVTVCFRRDFSIFRRCCGKTQYEVDGNTVSCTRDNFVELLDREKI